MKALVFLAICGAAYTSSDSLCLLPKEPGPCVAYVPRYFYNNEAKKCQLFIYGGCQGNANNFENFTECTLTCKPKLPVGIATLDSEPATLEPICRVWPWHPQCQYPFARFYNAMRSKVTLEPICRVWPWHPQCQYPFARYYTTMRSKVEVNPVCNETKYPGPCSGFFSRYYFNNETNTCEKFVYGGCQANGNNFGTLEECRNTCWASLDQHSLETNDAFEVPFWPFAPPEECAYSVEAGPCQAYMPRFFYNTLTKTCEQFVYGGCGGNANNFLTFDACEKKCKKVFGVVPRA
ncbi:carboxypeptidase inhibitor SmCI-like isoform X2 [Rhipicephalus microplus]|uniref:carboxypeptidase inhibitor SmCI-like isoform X2 n=1 Tax=Rhipicephalus microplus TaxID=6941 RepID=UPI003F6D5684